MARMNYALYFQLISINFQLFQKTEQGIISNYFQK